MLSAALFITYALLDDTRDLFASMLEDHDLITKDLIDAAGIDISRIPGLASHLEMSRNPFHGLETEYLKTQYL